MFLNINNMFYKFINLQTPVSGQKRPRHVGLHPMCGSADPGARTCRHLALVPRAWQPQRQVSATPPCPHKICTSRFLPNHPFNAKCIPMKRQLHPLAVFAILCSKSNSTITLLQSTVLYVQVNSNKNTELFQYIV